MKNTWIILLAATAIALFPMQGQAQYPYIRIADVVVNASNQDNITSDYISGTVRYDSTSRTLTLENATIYQYQTPDPFDEGNTVSIVGRYKDLNVEIIGTNMIYGTNPLVLYEGMFHLKGSGTLILNGIITGMYCQMGTSVVTISQGVHLVLNVSSTNGVGLEADTWEGAGTVFVVDSSSLTINASTCIYKLMDFELEGCFIYAPSGAYFDHDSMTLVSDAGVVRDYLEIRKGTLKIPGQILYVARVWGDADGIHISSDEEETLVEVYNIQGQMLRYVPLNKSDLFLPMPQGIYLVRIGGNGFKIVVG